MNYAVRTDRVIFDALPANPLGDYVGVLLLNKDDEFAQPQVDPQLFEIFLKEQIPQFIDYLNSTTLAKVAARPASTLPMFRYVTPRLYGCHGRIVLLGDCAHTVKPYFGMGANSALEDVKLLSQCIDERLVEQQQQQQQDDDSNDIKALELAIQDFSDIRAKDVETLVQVSHRLDRPGLAGIFTFLIPIVLDGIFSKLAPTIFAPNLISMLQNEEITFQQAVDRKRVDRIGQVGILLAVVIGVVVVHQINTVVRY